MKILLKLDKAKTAKQIRSTMADEYAIFMKLIPAIKKGYKKASI